MIISFAGHSTLPHDARIKDFIKKQLQNIIARNAAITCYLGGYGDFDNLCAQVCRELKQEFSHIELVYVTPYITISEQSKIKEMEQYHLYDSSIYPPIENTPPKFAVLKRNEWMMGQADVVIAYVSHSYGGAYKSIQEAMRKRKTIINIFELIK